MGAIEKTEGPCVILAGAGTGKTYTMVEKIKYLISNGVYKPERIVCITFSNEAANNLLSRVQAAVKIEPGREPVIKTFHAFSADLLRKYGPQIGINGEFGILDPDEAKVVLHSNLKITSYNCHRYVSSIGTAKDLGIGIEKVREYVKKKMVGIDESELDKKLEDMQFELQTVPLSKDKERKKMLSEMVKKLSSIVELRKFVNAWGAYEKIKQAKNYQDYSDLNRNALELLNKFPRIADDYDYVIVDEFQDTNKVQLDLLFALAYHGNITVVGDMNQSIYRFRGAYKENYNLFKERFKIRSEDIFTLDKSRRSPNKVLRTAHTLISNNYENKDECFKVESYDGREGQEINVYELKNAKEEARKVVEIVEEEILKGTSPEEICVLFRTHQQGAVMKRALEFKKINYCSVSKSSLVKQKSIKAVIDYLKIAHNLVRKEKGGEGAWWDLVYNSNFIEQDLMAIGKFIKDNKNSDNVGVLLFTSLPNLPLSDFGKFLSKVIIDRVKLLIPLISKNVPDFLTEAYKICGVMPDEKSKEGKEMTLNLNKFYELAVNHSALHSPDIGSFLHYLEVLESLGIEISSSSIEESGVRLMTLHATKGLEYKCVIVTNLAQKRFPMERISINTLIPTELYPELSHLTLNEEEMDYYVREYERKNQLLEERRLCYVAFTRAKERLVLTYAKEYGGKKVFASQFLQEINCRNAPDFVFISDMSDKYSEPELKIAPAIKLSFMLGSDGSMPEEAKGLEIEIPGRRDIVQREAPGNITFSPSALLCFSECQKKYEYQYVYNMPEKKPLSWDAIMLGSFVHQVLEIGVKKNTKELQEFINIARELHLKEDWQSVELNDALHLIRVFFERNKNKYNERSKTELFLKAKIGGFWFIGFADRIDYLKDGIEIVDYKTGRQYVSPLHRNWQLGYYALAAKSLGLGKVKRLTLDMLKLEKPLEFEVDDAGNAVSTNADMQFNIHEIEAELIDTARMIIDSYKNGFKPCPIEKNCDFCNEYVYGL